MTTTETTKCTRPYCHRCADPTLHAVADAPLRPLSDLLKAAVEFERAVKAYSAWNTRPSDSDEYEQRKYDAMKSLFAAVKVLS